jgi:hypothetical protein
MFGRLFFAYQAFFLAVEIDAQRGILAQSRDTLPAVAQVVGSPQSDLVTADSEGQINA